MLDYLSGSGHGSHLRGSNGGFVIRFSLSFYFAFPLYFFHLVVEVSSYHWGPLMQVRSTSSRSITTSVTRRTSNSALRRFTLAVCSA